MSRISASRSRFRTSRHSAGRDLYDAIVVARDQIRRQLKDYKTKLKDKHERGGRPDKK